MSFTLSYHGLWPKITIALLFVLSLMGMYSPTPAWACTATPTGIPPRTIADQVAWAQVVFVGTVTNMQVDEWGLSVATIQVEQYYKGQSATMTVTLGNIGQPSVCQAIVDVGQRAAFFASGNPMTGLQARYLSAGDAVLPATTEIINQILAALGQPTSIPQATFTPTPTISIGEVTISPTPTNTPTPTPTRTSMFPPTPTPFGNTPTPTPTHPCRERCVIIPTATPTLPPNMTIVWPTLSQVQPNVVGRGQAVMVTGRGGYLSYNEGGYDESARNFTLYLDQIATGTIVCYVNHCEGQLYIPTETTLGSHIISVEGGSNLSITVGEGTVSPTPHPSVTPRTTQTPQPQQAKLIVTSPMTQVTVGQAFDIAINLDTQNGCGYATYDLTLSQSPGQPLEYLSPQKIGPGVGYTATFTLRAVSTGTVKIKATAYGEYNCNGAWTWGYVNGESAEITIGASLPPVHLDLGIPKNGGKFGLNGGNELEISPQTFGQAVILRYTPLTTVIAGTLQGVGLMYELSAIGSQGQAIQPQQAYTLTMRYDPSRLPPHAEVAIYFYQNGQWVKEPTSQVDEAHHLITAHPTHFSQWGIMARVSANRKLYLPLIMR